MATKKDKAAPSAKGATLKIVQSNSETTPVGGDSPPPAPEASVGGLHYDSLYREGREALERINTSRDFTDWLKVTPALDAARTEAMNKAGVNRPIGATYNKAFGEILKREGLWRDKLDSTTRNQLFDLYKHRSLIEEWRAKLEPGLRRKLNHPSSVLGKWSKTEEGRKALGKPRGGGGGGNKRKTAAQLRKQNEQLTARIKEVEEERDLVKEKRDQLERESSPGFTEPATAITTLISAVLQPKDLPQGVKAADLLDLAERIRRLAAEVEAACAEETVH
jgi:hypothetical protein